MLNDSYCLIFCRTFNFKIKIINFFCCIKFKYSEYSKEKVKYEFRKNKLLNDPKNIESLLEKAQQNLDLIKRQVR